MNNGHSVARTDGHSDVPAPALVDPLAVRVSLGPSMLVDGVAPMVLSPAPEPFVMLEASSGAGLLGGLVVDAARGAPPRPAGVVVDGEASTARLARIDAEHARLDSGDGRPSRAVLLLPPDVGQATLAGAVRREVVVDGWRIEVDVEAESRAALRERARRGRVEAGQSGPTEVNAIIPGVVVAVSVIAGDSVVAGQQLLAVEAMKMQNELRAPRDGTIERVAVAVGQTIEVGDLLLVLG